MEGPETWSEEYSKLKGTLGRKPKTNKQPYRRSRSYSPNVSSGGFYRNPYPVTPYQSENQPSSRSRRGAHTYSKGKNEGLCDTSDGKKSSGYGSYQSKNGARRMGKKDYPDRPKQLSAEKSSSNKRSDRSSSRTKSAEKLRLEKLRHEGVEDSSLTTSTSQCSTENSGNGKSTEADVESSLDEIHALQERAVGMLGCREHTAYQRGRQNRSYDHVREIESHDTVFNRSLPPVLRPEMAAGGTHVCNVSAGSNCSSKSDHVLQWLQQNARQGILTAAPPPPQGGHAISNAGMTSTTCACPNCRPPGNAQEVSTKLLAVLQQGSVQTITSVNQPLQQSASSCQSLQQASSTCQFQGSTTATNEEGQGILALLKPQDIVCGGGATCDMQQCPDCVQAMCNCMSHSNLNTSGGLLPIPQFHSPQHPNHQCLQPTHSICANTSPLRHTVLQSHPPSVCGGGSPCQGAVICGNTLHQGVVQPGVNVCSSPLRPGVADGLSNTVCSSSPLQQARVPGLDESMLSSISAIHLYQSPDRNNSITKGERENICFLGY